MPFVSPPRGFFDGKVRAMKHDYELNVYQEIAHDFLALNVLRRNKDNLKRKMAT